MFSTIQSLFSMRSQAKEYTASARILDANALATRKHANAQATAIEQTARANMAIAGENMMTARSNQRATLAAAENNRAASGFSGGTSDQPLHSIEKTLDKQLANLALSASIASLNAWQSAKDTRHQGEIQALAIESQADQYRRAAKSIRNQMWINSISSVANAAASAYSGYTAATARNTALTDGFMSQSASLRTQLQNGTITQDQFNQQSASLWQQTQAATVNPWESAFLSGSQGFSAGFDIANSYSPYTAAISGNPNTRKNNYGGAWSVLMGNIPYRVPSADAAYKFTN